MVEEVHIENHPKSYLTNHALIMLMIIHSLQQHESTWTTLLALSHAPITEIEESESE